MIYLDNAATTKIDNEALKELLNYTSESYGNSSQPYSIGRKQKLVLNKARREIAKCINAEENEIFFTSGGSESDNWAIKCFGLNDDIKHIVTSKIEHHAILNACKDALSLKSDVTYLNVDNKGLVDTNELKKYFERSREFVASCETTLVSIMMVNNEIGTVEPIKELAKIAHKNGALFHTDAVQAVGHIKIDVKELDVDMLSASAHKFNGPKGIGFLYIKKGTIIQPLISGGQQESGMRAGTENVGLISSMAKALLNNINELDNNQKKLMYLEQTLIDELNSCKIDFIRNGSENHLPGLVNISIKGANGEMLLHRLDLMEIYISTGSACDSVNNQISHVIKAIKVPKEYAEGTIRISFGKDNTIEDAISVADALKKVLN